MGHIALPWPAEGNRQATATLHEAAGQRGALPHEIKPVAPSFLLWGRALPVATGEMDNTWVHRALAIAQPGDVLIIKPSGPEPAGYWGEVLSWAARARGIGGVVIDGHCRDCQKLGEVGVPVFARGVCIRGTRKDPASRGSVGETITIGSVDVCSGDLVVGDADGVVVLPANDAAAVIDAAIERERHEVEVMDLLAGGATTLEIYGIAQERLEV